MDSPLVERARALAQVAHASQVRKASGLPYFTHLEGVACLLDQHGYTDDTSLAAAYLHDLIEDQPHATDWMRQEMPPAVVQVVEALTEQKLDASGQKRPKQERFADYLAGLAGHSELACRAIPISCADRIHNTRSIVHDEKLGYRPFMQLSTRPGELLEQLEALRAVYQPVVKQGLLSTFDRAAHALRETIQRWLPSRAAMIAAEAHLGRLDSAGDPSVLHPMRLALAAGSVEEKVVAMLYGTLDVGRYTLEELEREGFSSTLLRALEHLTRRPEEDFSTYIERVAGHRLATRVKLLDLTRDQGSSPLRQGAPIRSGALDERAASARLRAELEKRSLYVLLDTTSQELLRAQARLPIVKGQHVTLAHRVHPNSFDPAWVPGTHGIGSVIPLHARWIVRSSEIEAVAVEIAGVTTRPQDGGTLHVTLSRSKAARSYQANQLLRTAPHEPFTAALCGKVCWVED